MIIRPKPTLVYPLSDIQTIFDYVWHHFIVEKNPPGKDDVGCVYNTPSGGCAIGCLLKPDVRLGVGDYRCSIGTAMRAVQAEDAMLSIRHTFDINLEVEFLTNLQHSHDNSASELSLQTETFIESMMRRLRSVAGSYALTVPTEETPRLPLKEKYPPGTPEHASAGWQPK